MGCIRSKPDINDQHPNIFQVINVDQEGEPKSPGQIEVTETELVLYQRGKQPTIWPLRSLRKYGFDQEIFSFECGRRCPTGQGIYAFRTRKAEHLFNIVQQHIARSNSNNDDTAAPLPPPLLHQQSGAALNIISPSSNGGEFVPVPLVSNGPPVQPRHGPFYPEGYLNPVGVAATRPPLNRPGSIASNGTISPTAISPPPIVTPTSMELGSGLLEQNNGNNNNNDNRSSNNNNNISSNNNNNMSSNNNNSSSSTNNINNSSNSSNNNNNKQGTFVLDHPYTNITVVANTVVNTVANAMASLRENNSNPYYANLEISAVSSPIGPCCVMSPEAAATTDTTIECPCNAYMNTTLPNTTNTKDDNNFEDDTKHCYANIDAKDLEHLRPMIVRSQTTSNDVAPLTSSAQYANLYEVNYAELDLEPGKNCVDVVEQSVPQQQQQQHITTSPDSPTNKTITKDSYATIDFQKTNALSQSINPRIEVDEEGSRKTRHNSTISDVTTTARHSNSLSD